MFMLKAPLHDPDRREELPEGTSTLILRKVPAELNMSSVYMLLNRSAPGKLDFVYVPFNARKSTNISLAFVNFVDAGSAKKAYDFLQSVNTTMHWDIAVSAGNIQGFASNLAYYVARFGLSAISKPWAPLIFRCSAAPESTNPKGLKQLPISGIVFTIEILLLHRYCLEVHG